MSKKKLHPHTEMIRLQSERSQNREHSVPLYLTSSFTFESAAQMEGMFKEEIKGNIYSRYSNPNVSEFVQKICTLEGAENGFATTTGMSAVFNSIAALLSQGDHIVSTNAIFGSTHQILKQVLPRFGITHTYVKSDEPDTWEAAIQPNTKMFLCETPSNPGLRIVDLKKAGELCKAHNLILNVDNCFATPIIQQPIKFGANIVTHSATKFIDGQGRILGGVIAGDAELIEKVIFFARHTGPIISAFNAWLLSKSLETLPLRMEKHCFNAKTLAERLVGNKCLNQVLYPELASFKQREIALQQMSKGGALVSIDLKGGIEAGVTFMNNIEMCSLSSNLGDSRTIVTHPATSTHSKLSKEERSAAGITDGMIRISVGLEYIDDIYDDIEQALAKCR